MLDEQIVETSTSKQTLYKCLNNFCRPEKLGSVVYCEKCNRKTETLKQLSFQRFPKVLCFHFNRFDAIKDRKVSNVVDFPSELNMGNYCAQWKELRNGFKLGNDFIEINEGKDAGLSPCALYGLFGTVNLKGSLHQGHYSANVKVQSSGDWFYCNDESIYKTTQKLVLQSDASSGEPYILFYINQHLS